MSEIERAVNGFKIENALLSGSERNKNVINRNKIAITALQEKSERDNPKPLTLDELREMDGQPVWFVWTQDSLFPMEKWRIWDNTHKQVFCDDAAMSPDYGKTWLAYRYKPKDDNT